MISPEEGIVLQEIIILKKSFFLPIKVIGRRGWARRGTIARAASGASLAVRERDEVAMMSSSTSSEEVTVNNRVKIIDKVRMSSKEPNMQASMEEASDSLGED